MAAHLRGSDFRQAECDPLTPGGWLVVAVLVVCAVQPGDAEARGASTPEERARFVALVKSLEGDPLAGHASITRQQLRDWTIEVPDIRFTVCPDLLGEAIGDDYAYRHEINVQVVLSGAVLTLEDPGKARDDVAVYTAGVEGALRAYDVLVKSTPDARLAALDELIAKRDRGELVDHVARLARARCTESAMLSIAAPSGAAAGLALALLVAQVGWRRPAADGHRSRAGISTTTAAILRNVVLLCAGYYLLVGGALHVLEPEYDPRFNFMSDYAWGAYGWLMTTTFFVLGLAVVMVAVGVRQLHQSSRSARVGFGLLVVGAAFVCLAGVFRGFPLHDVASAVGIPSLVMAALLVSWSFRSAPEWQGIHSVTLSIAVGMLAAVVSMIVDIGMPGLQQRAFFALLLLWLSIVARRGAIAAAACSAAGGDAASPVRRHTPHR